MAIWPVHPRCLDYNQFPSRCRPLFKCLIDLDVFFLFAKHYCSDSVTTTIKDTQAVFKVLKTRIDKENGDLYKLADEFHAQKAA